MSKPTRENIATVINGLADYFYHMIRTQSFNLEEFSRFMEPRFAAAGYRDKIDYNIFDNSCVCGGDILILTEPARGDFIVTTAAIREIRRIYPGTRIVLLVSRFTFELAEICPYVDEVIKNTHGGSISNLFEFYRNDVMMAAELLERRFDICFSFSIHAPTPLLMYMSGAKIRVTSIDCENLATFKKSNTLADLLTRLSTHIFPYNNYGYHRVDRFLSLVENFLHLPITNRKPELWLTPEDISFAQDQLNNLPAPIYSLNMGGNYKINHYPPEKYARLIEMILREEPQITFVILGGGKVDLDSAAIFKNSLPEIYRKNILDLTNKTTLRQTIAILSRCDLHIGNDTGARHMAAAVGRPVLSPIPFAADLPILNTDCPKRWYPYGVPSVLIQPEHVLPECRFQNFHAYRGCAASSPHCITQIEPATLFKGFKLLKERAMAGINEPLYVH